MATTDTQLEQIIFNTLSQEKYDELKASGQINPNEIYLVPDTNEVPENVVQSDNYENAKLWKGTLAEYEALGTYDDSITYIITDDTEELDVYTKQEVDEKLENVTVDLSDYATISNVEALVSPKADKTYVDEELGKKADKSDTYTKSEVEGLINNATPNIIGGQYIDVYQKTSTSLYEHTFQDQLKVNMGGVDLCNSIYLPTSDLGEIVVTMNDLMSFPQVSVPNELYLCTLPTSFETSLIPAYDSNNQPMSLYQAISDVAYQMIGLTELTEENKKAFVETFTNSEVDPMTPLYVVHGHSVMDDGTQMDMTMGCFYNKNNDLCAGIIYIWNGAYTNEIQIQSAPTTVVDWNQKAIDLINNLDLLPSQTDNAGKFLTTDGTTASWSEVPQQDISGKADKSDTYTKSEVDNIVENIDALPSQEGNEGKVLVSNGTEANWQEETPSAIMRVWD